MKKLTTNLLAIIAVALCLASFTACGGGGGDTPSGKALEMTGFLQDGDYDSFAENVYFGKDASSSDIDELAQMLEMKGRNSIEKKDGIASYELVSEDIAEDGTTATVYVKVVYGDGSDKKERMRMIKDESGEWKNKLR